MAAIRTDTVGVETADRPARGMFRLLIDPLFGLFFWGKLLSTTGVWIHNIVAALIAFQLTGSALVVGMVSAAQFLPQLLLTPLSGTMADRGRRERQIIVGRLVGALGSGGLAAWIWLAGGIEGLPGAAPIVASSAVVGLSFVIGGPAMQSIVPALIRKGELAPAMALNGTPMIAARVAGPALGALIAVQLSPAIAFALAAAGNALFAICVSLLTVPQRPRPARGTDFSVRAALRYLRTDRPLILLLVIVGAVGIGAEPSVTLGPAIADSLGAGSGFVGWLTSAFGIGAAVGLLIFTPLRRGLGLARSTNVGLAILAIGLCAVSVGHTQTLTLLAFGVAGIGMTLAFTGSSTLLQARLPESLRGRIMALWLVAFTGLRPVAAGLTGLLADIASIAIAVLATAIVVAVAAMVCRPKLLTVPVPHTAERG
ncbi:putative MFS family arabinose efflux permease [Tamaricihabitans halophyticus]|uniref:Putative MFS family arabinose efflux permease n=1 Tax=Tamaricihabitans halophyticus TaxID=1262583 RepID=A0A4R2QH43_9PSEU|nr:MFS transporter [Tamaricihabitans halophyticus]TCP47894.1 putative MFS family arabinose efflux permease [Tamaricihabitans halophyticus]